MPITDADHDDHNIEELEKQVIESHIASIFYINEHLPISTTLPTSPALAEVVIDCNSIQTFTNLPQPFPNFTPTFCVDSGAPRSVIGQPAFLDIKSHFKLPDTPLGSSRYSFKFGNNVHKSLGTTQFILATPRTIPDIHVNLDIVDVNIPPLIGLDILDKNGLMIDNINNKLAKRKQLLRNGITYYMEEWYLPLFRSASSHLHTMMHPLHNHSILFTTGELNRLHRQFFHPAPTKLFNLLKRTHPSQADPETLKILNDITNRCDPCQRITSAPLRFRVSFGSDSARFNERIYMDVFYITIKKTKYTILHIIDEGTRFSSAVRLKNMETKTVWNALITSWTSIYTGLPNRIIVDQGSNFGDSFIRMASLDGIQVERTGIESHNGLSICERYHSPIRSTVRKILTVHPKSNFDLVLALAVKALNDTSGPEGLVPSALVFGEFPRLDMPSEYNRRPTSDERGEIATMARNLMRTHLDTMRISRALRHNVPSATDKIYEEGDDILVWREKGHTAKNGEYLGPFKVSSFDRSSKLVYIHDIPNAKPRPFNTSQVKHYLSPSTLSSTLFSQLKQSLTNFMSPSDSDDIFMTEIIPTKDSRSQSPEMMKARREEIANLIKRGTFKIILKEDVPTNANILPGRFVLSLKSTIDGTIKHKARFVIGGHRDKLKNLMVHSSQTLQPQSIRLLLALACIFGFPIWTSDVSQAYLQSAIPLSRDLFLSSTVPELELDATQCLQIIQPLYGLSESGDLWYHTLQQHHLKDLGMKQLCSDSSFFYLLKDHILQGMSGTYVDDLLRAGDPEFLQLSKQTEKRFEMKTPATPPCDFSGFRINYTAEQLLQQTQRHYIKKLENVENDCSFSSFRSMRMRLAWLSHTRPDCSFEISRLAQVTEHSFINSPSTYVSLLNKATRYATRHDVSIIFPQLDQPSLKIIGYSDASFSNNMDLSSQLGFIIFLQDNTNAIIPQVFKSYKAKRLCRSAMAAEVIAFSDLFDSAYTLKRELSILLNRTISLELFTDSKSLFDAISKGSRTSEKRLMLDVATARQGFRSGEISNIGLVRSERNVADGLTKPMAQAALREILQTGEHSPSPVQWIIRHTSDTSNET